MINNILVSGVAGDIGFSVGRIIKTLGAFYKLHGIDIHDKHAGLCIFEQCHVAPKANDIHYIEWLSDYIIKNNIHIFIPTSEAEIYRLANEQIKFIEGAKVLISNDLVVTNGLDKYECLAFLSKKGIRVPMNGLVSKKPPAQYPVIIKPRSGQGSKNIIYVDNESMYLSKNIQHLNDFVWQEYLGTDDQEYTCAIYNSTKVKIRTIILRRKLQGGFTVSGEVVNNNEITNYIENISTVMNLNGVMNIQLRLTSDGPKIFEINPRLSSTLVFRDKMGFCDLRWWLSDALDLKVEKYKPVKSGRIFYRGIQEYII